PLCLNSLLSDSVPLEHRALLSFPTRRSSDLAVAKGAAVYARMLQAEEQPAVVKMFDNPETKKLKRIVGRSYGISAYVDGTDHRKDRKSTRLNSSHVSISYAVFCLKKKKHDTI